MESYSGSVFLDILSHLTGKKSETSIPMFEKLAGRDPLDLSSPF